MGGYLKRDGIGLVALTRLNPRARQVQEQLERVREIWAGARQMVPEQRDAVASVLHQRIEELEGELDALRREHDALEARIGTLEGRAARNLRVAAELQLRPFAPEPVPRPPVVHRPPPPPPAPPPVPAPVLPFRFFRRATEEQEAAAARAAEKAARAGLRAHAAALREEDKQSRERARETSLLKQRAARRALGFTLSEEDCWAQGSATWYGRPGRSHVVRRPARLEYHRPNVCDACGKGDLSWNGATWYCNTCNAPVFLEVLVYQDVQAPGTASAFAVSPRGRWDDGDAFYEDATALYKVPMALNWPHGRIRPHIRRTNEGKPRADAYGWRPRREGWRS